MKQLLEKLNHHLKTKGNETYVNSDISQLLTNNWSCTVVPVEYRTRTVISIDNRLILRWVRNKIELLFDGETLYKSDPLTNLDKIKLSFAFSESLIRIQGTENHDGTFKLNKRIVDFNPTNISFHSSHVLSLGEPEVFPKEDALKNMSGLNFWFKPENSDVLLVPPERLEFSGSNCSLNDYILFFAIEPYEYSSQIQDQSIIKIEMTNGYIEYVLSYTEEEISNSKEPEYSRQLYITQKISIDDVTYETKNFVDVFYKNWLIKNERPGPTILFLSTQSTKENIATIENYNYHDKWFIFDRLHFNVSNLNLVNIIIGGTYHGKIKEVFLFNRALFTDEAFDDQSIKWIMAYLKKKYAITDTLIKLK